MMMMMMAMAMITNIIPYRRTKTHIWDKVIMGIWVHPTIITNIITMLILQGEHEEPARDHAVVSLQQRLLLELPHQDHP